MENMENNDELGQIPELKRCLTTFKYDDALDRFKKIPEKQEGDTLVVGIFYDNISKKKHYHYFMYHDDDSYSSHYNVLDFSAPDLIFTINFQYN
jgi:hypothetical protein